MVRLPTGTISTQRYLLAGLVLLALLGWSAAAGFAQTIRRAVPEPLAALEQGASIVALFEWPWNDVAQECEQFLSPAGYAAVLVVPPNEHAIISSEPVAFPWFQRYQPVSYRLDRTRSGSGAEFRAMIERCQAVGVAVYVEVVINHMAGSSGTAALPATGSAGTRYTRYHYPGLFGPQDFRRFAGNGCHHPDGLVARQDWQPSTTSGEQRRRADNLWYCEVEGAPDLDLGSARVRALLAEYLAGLIRLGVRGLRIDKIEHVHPVELDLLLDAVNEQVRPIRPHYILGIARPGDLVTAAEYLAVNNDADEARPMLALDAYATMLAQVINQNSGQSLADLPQLLAEQPLESQRALIFLDTALTQREVDQGQRLSYHNGVRYDLGAIFMLAWPYGSPQIMSSYAFDQNTHSNPSAILQGPPADAQGTTNGPFHDQDDGQQLARPRCFGTVPGVDWVCEHRWLSIAQMVSFRRGVAGEPVVDWWDNGANQIAFGRGARGFVVINREVQPLTRLWHVRLADGRYCNIAVSRYDLSTGECAGPQYVVRQGWLYENRDGMLVPPTVVSFGALVLQHSEQMATAE